MTTAKPKPGFTEGPYFTVGHSVMPERPGMAALTEIAVCRPRRVGPLKISAMEAQANARLFAAAPEMYELLQRFMDLGAPDDLRIAAEQLLAKIDGDAR